jgi:molybdate/tungstate transport system substrate-binding protein
VKTKLCALLISALTLVLVSCAAPAQTVSVLYAGSLVTPMEGPIAAALAQRGIDFQGEARGSKEIANLIVAGLRKPDVVILVDPAIAARLERRGLVAESCTLGATFLGLAWSDASKFGRIYANAGGKPAALATALKTPGLRIARTDPRLDPKGEYTIDAARTLLGNAGERAVLGSGANPAQTFPEEDLLVRLETDEADVGFVYETEAYPRHLHFALLPERALRATKVLYTIAIAREAPHPAAARAFASFLLNGAGRAILQGSGVAMRKVASAPCMH